MLATPSPVLSDCSVTRHGKVWSLAAGAKEPHLVTCHLGDTRWSALMSGGGDQPQPRLQTQAIISDTGELSQPRPCGPWCQTDIERCCYCVTKNDTSGTNITCTRLKSVSHKIVSTHDVQSLSSLMSHLASCLSPSVSCFSALVSARTKRVKMAAGPLIDTLEQVPGPGHWIRLSSNSPNKPTNKD